MALRSLEARTLEIPYRVAFRPSPSERRTTRSLWVTARDEDDLRGDGEGCPRESVTGESIATALAFLMDHRTAWKAQISGIESLREWLGVHRPQVDRNPAAWCAVELALLDLFGKRAGVPVEALLGSPRPRGRFRYTAVIGEASDSAFDAQLRSYLQAGFRDIKIRLSGEFGRDAGKVAALERAGVVPRLVRADAHNLWREPGRAIDYLRKLEFAFAAIEEPLALHDFEGMRAVSKALEARVILDESLVKCVDFEAIGADANRWVANIRVSKMGGLLRALECVETARAAGVAVIVGAHVGETSVLTRAGLALGAFARDVLVAQEGALGTHLLERDITEPSLAYGPGGELDADAIAQGPGLGLAIAGTSPGNPGE
ncbi:MAG TPA: enolase C-terminal domain-like protein [Usitatibacter sp.]|nr:enolase C-terminal domain-like protein [Usitatibacter sp.]